MIINKTFSIILVFWFAIYMQNGESRYCWICKDCGYVYDTDYKGIKITIPFVKGHICLENYLTPTP